MLNAKWFNAKCLSLKLKLKHFSCLFGSNMNYWIAKWTLNTTIHCSSSQLILIIMLMMFKCIHLETDFIFSTIKNTIWIWTRIRMIQVKMKSTKCVLDMKKRRKKNIWSVWCYVMMLYDDVHFDDDVLWIKTNFETLDIFFSEKIKIEKKIMNYVSNRKKYYKIFTGKILFQIYFNNNKNELFSSLFFFIIFNANFKLTPFIDWFIQNAFPFASFASLILML